MVSLLILLILLLSCNITSAERLKGKGLSELYRSINYDSQTIPTVICDNGLIVRFTSLRVCDMPIGGNLEESGNYYWYKAGIVGINHILGVQGVYLELTNSTDKILIVKWSESSFNLGNFSGIPLLAGMKYNDAGNPSATPDTIIPPNKSVNVVLYISDVTFGNGNWVQGYEYVRVDNSLRASVYMKVLDDKGSSSYSIAESPTIFLPPSALTNVTIYRNK